jgi:hypothetical protein
MGTAVAFGDNCNICSLFMSTQTCKVTIPQTQRINVAFEVLGTTITFLSVLMIAQTCARTVFLTKGQIKFLDKNLAFDVRQTVEL